MESYTDNSFYWTNNTNIQRDIDDVFNAYYEIDETIPEEL